MTTIPDKASLEGIEARWRARWEADGTYRFDAEVTATGEQAVGLRLQYLDRSDEHRLRTLAQSVAGTLTGAEATNVRFTTLEDLQEEVRYAYTLTLKQWARRIEDILLFRIPWSEPLQTSGPMSAGGGVPARASARPERAGLEAGSKGGREGSTHRVRKYKAPEPVR